MRKWHYIISEQCNLNCNYCNVDINSNIRLDKEFFDNFLEELQSYNEPYTFSIFGGEPFLQVDIIKHIISSLENDKNLIQIIIPTNGTIFNKDIQNIIVHPKVKISISYDGIKQLQNRGSQKLYIEEFSKNNEVSGHCMIIGDDFEGGNYQDFLIINHKNIKSVGLVPNMTLVRDIGTWNQRQVVKFKISYTEYVKYITSKIDEYKTFNELPGLIKTYLNPIMEYYIKNNIQNDCRCGEIYLSILPNKEILPCERFDRDKETILKLKNKEIILSKCDTCDIRNVCHKGCTYEQLKNNEPIDDLCDIYKHINQTLKEILIKETKTKILKLFNNEI